MSDLIDRQAAIDLVTDMDFMNNTAKGILRDRLRKLPSAQPERKTGKWLHETKHYKDDEQEFYYIKITCSNCGVNASKPWQQTNYCWNCGADMRG